MAKYKRYVVRVVVAYSDKNQDVHLQWAEQLRYMGHAKIHTVASRTDITNVIDLLPPHDVDSYVWAKQNADRMTSFGYNAVAAPEMSNG